MVRISAEENFHKKQGQDLVIRMALGTPRQKAMVQDAINRWWWPTMMMFGPRDRDSPNSPTLIRWGIKTKTNDELRQEFVDKIVPELFALGLSVPDPFLRFDAAREHWIFGEIDWEEFWRVVKGKGPCNQERLQARISAHADGRWVREALFAYAKKMKPS
jgi:ring-1,2-phenylacetyl-CoA epoxidase subunit PaaA